MENKNLNISNKYIKLFRYLFSQNTEGVFTRIFATKTPSVFLLNFTLNRKILIYNSLRNLATAMFNCSRYLATVRRAIS